jgi:hypothetical protein
VYRWYSYIGVLFFMVLFLAVAMIGARYQFTAVPLWFFGLMLLLLICVHLYVYRCRRQLLADPFRSVDVESVWVDFLLNFGLVGFFGSALWVSLATINGTLDTTQGREISVLIIEKLEPRARSSSRKFVFLSPSGETRSIVVSKQLFNTLNTGQHVAIVFHQGYFGWEWLELADDKGR